MWSQITLFEHCLDTERKGRVDPRDAQVRTDNWLCALDLATKAGEVSASPYITHRRLLADEGRHNVVGASVRRRSVELPTLIDESSVDTAIEFLQWRHHPRQLLHGGSILNQLETRSRFPSKLLQELQLPDQDLP